jgi:hypothetical protein
VTLPAGTASAAEPGCAADAAAVVTHRAGNAAKPPARTPARVRCERELGAHVTEANLVADGRGSIYIGMTASGGADVLRSDDRGATWRRLTPAEGDARIPSAGMSWLVRDPDSGRLFASSLMDPACANPIFSDVIAYSDSRGARWRVHRGKFCDGGDWGKTFLGPPATSAHRQALRDAGYPNAVYHCMGATVQVTRQCWRSLDGGDTWQRTANPVSEYPTLGLGVTPAPYTGPPDADATRLFGECGLEGARYPDPHVLPGNGVVGADGTIYIPSNACGDVVLSVSDDGGDTWRTSPIPDAFSRGWYPHGDGVGGFVVPQNGGLPHAPAQGFRSIYGEAAMSALFSQQFTIDAKGNIYFAWVDARDDRPYLMVSRDGARTWGRRTPIAPPGLRWASTATVTVEEPGHVAVAYFGTREQTAYDGYLSETHDALAAEPTWQTTSVTGKGRALQPNGIGEPTEYVGLDIAPDGSAWAVFPRDTCVYDPAKAGIQCDDYTHYDQERYEGVVLRLAPRKSCAARTAATVTAPARVRGRRVVGGRVRFHGRSFPLRARDGRLRARLPLAGLRPGSHRAVLRLRLANGKRRTIVRRVRNCA